MNFNYVILETILTLIISDNWYSFTFTEALRGGNMVINLWEREINSLCFLPGVFTSCLCGAVGVASPHLPDPPHLPSVSLISFPIYSPVAAWTSQPAQFHAAPSLSYTYRTRRDPPSSQFLSNLCGFLCLCSSSLCDIVMHWPVNLDSDGGLKLFFCLFNFAFK